MEEQLGSLTGMDTPHETLESSENTPDASEGCSTAQGCGFKGMCPGHALLLAFLAGVLLGEWTGISWLMPVVTIGLSVVLISGIWRRLLPAPK